MPGSNPLRAVRFGGRRLPSAQVVSAIWIQATICNLLSTILTAPAAVPGIVFVSRAPAAAPGVVPGLGPAGRSLAPGGRLLLREPDGRVRELLPAGALWDVSDPAVSPDARTILFAGTPAPDSAWRLYRVSAAGGSPERLALASAPGADDIDPCWIGPGAIVFASTRGRRVAPYAAIPVTQLYRWDLGPAAPRQLTFERGGAEEPAWDARTGRVLFSRWWFNRHHPADSGGLAPVRAGEPEAERANLWHVMSVAPAGGAPRLEAGRMSARRTAMGYQVAPLADGDVLAVFARNTGLFPAGGEHGIARLDRAGRRTERLAGAALEADAPEGYGGAGGLAAPSAVSPAALPDGRVVFAFDPSGRGDYGVVVADARGDGRVTLVDLPGTLELDPAPLVPRAMRAPPPFADRTRDMGGAPRESLLAAPQTFRYRNRDVFAGAGAPPRSSGASIRFYAALDRPHAAGGDTAVLLRERPVPRSGRVDESGLPSGVPMFEQLLDAHGRVLQGALGPAHVLGLNTGHAGGTLSCSGCHAGHSRRR